MNNFQSISYFLPELLIIQLALSIIILDLLSLKKWMNLCVYLGFAFIALLLYQFAPLDVSLWVEKFLNKMIKCRNCKSSKLTELFSFGKIAFTGKFAKNTNSMS